MPLIPAATVFCFFSLKEHSRIRPGSIFLYMFMITKNEIFMFLSSKYLKLGKLVAQAKIFFSSSR